MPSKELFLGGLSKETRRQDLEDIFSKYGRINRCEIKYGKGYSGTAYGFIGYDSERDAEDALKNENGRKLLGMSILIEFSKTKPWDKATKASKYHSSRNESGYGYKRRRSCSRSLTRSRSRSRSRNRRRRQRHRTRSRSRSRSRSRRRSDYRRNRRSRSSRRSNSRTRTRSRSRRRDDRTRTRSRSRDRNSNNNNTNQNANDNEPQKHNAHQRQSHESDQHTISANNETHELTNLIQIEINENDLNEVNIDKNEQQNDATDEDNHSDHDIHINDDVQEHHYEGIHSTNEESDNETSGQKTPTIGEMSDFLINTMVTTEIDDN